MKEITNLILILLSTISCFSQDQGYIQQTEKNISIHIDSFTNYYQTKTSNEETNNILYEKKNIKADSCWLNMDTISKKYNLCNISIPTNMNPELYNRSKEKLIESFNHYDDALSLYDSIKSYDMKFIVLNMMGLLLIEVGEFNKGIEYLNYAVNIKDSLSFIGYISEWKSNLGYAWNTKNELDSSLFYYNQAYNIAIKNKLPVHEALACTNIGEIQLKNTELSKAKKNIERGLFLFSKLNNVYGEFYAKSLLGEYYFMQKQYHTAEQYFSDAEKQIDSLNILVALQKRHYEREYKLYKKIGYYQKALFAFEKYKDAEHAILNKEVRWKIEQLERSVDLSQKEKVIEEQKQNLIIKDFHIKLMKNRIFMYSMIGFIILLTLLSVIIITVIKRKKDKEMFKSEVLEIITRYKLQNIQAQLSPHFIFNALNNFWRIIEAKDKDYAYNYLNNISSLFRSVLIVSEKNTVTLKEELDFVKKFLELEKISQQDKFEYFIDVADNVSYNTPIIPMCIQTHVENALKHGIKPKNTKGNIVISIKNIKNYMLVAVEDDGVGRNKTIKQEKISTGIGL